MDAASQSAARRIARNTVVLVVLRVVMPALAVALVLLLSRVLGAEGLGRYTLAFSFLFLFNALAPLGLPTLVTREGARDPSTLQRMLANALSLTTLASLLLTAAMMATGWLLNYDGETRSAMVILSLMIVPFVIGAFQDAVFVALERMGYIAITASVEYAIKVGGGIALLLAGYGLDAVLAMAVVGRFAGCLVGVGLLRRVGVATRWHLDPAIQRQLLASAPTFLSIAIFATLYWRIDVFMLSKLRPLEDVGYYSAAWRVLELAMVVPQSLALALYPQIAANAGANPESVRRVGEAALRYLFAISIPAACCATVLAEPVLELLYGPGFGPAQLTLAVLIWTLVPYGVVRYQAYVLVGMNRQRVDLWLNIVMSAVNVGLNLLLIPRYSYLGAAVATLVSILGYAVVQSAYLHRRTPEHASRLRLSPVMLLGSGLAATAAWLLRDASVWLALAAAPLVYLSVLLLGRFFTPAERAMLRLDRLTPWRTAAAGQGGRE